MTVREIVQMLREEGHVVEYYERKDGGILIKSIDGTKYQGATGNKVGRRMVGDVISEKRGSQLQRITTTGERAKNTLTDNEVKKALQRVQRMWRKAFPHKRGEKPSVGLKTTKQVKWNLEHKGKEETLRLLAESERYAKGLAYTENVKTFVEHLMKWNKKRNNESMSKLINDIVVKSEKIRQEDLYQAYQIAYDLNKRTIPIEETIRRIRVALKLDE